MKRICSTVLVLAVVLSCCAGAFAATDRVARTSNILEVYTASAATGTNSGEVKITYRSRANQSATTIGVSSIEIYKSDGSYVTTIWGSTSNGLMAGNTQIKNGTYVYKGTSGVYYRAKVTISATAGGETDNKPVWTSSARAK